MGQRANLVIRRNGEWRLFYDHWCANRLDVELFWGPRLAAAFIEQRKPASDRSHWLDEVWAEGGAIIDEDAHVLVWFGGEDIAYDVPLRRALIDLMQLQWPGWEVRWATGAIAELGAYLGIPEDRFLVESVADYAFTVLTEYPEDNDTLLTVHEDGVTLVARVHGHEEALQIGPSQVPTLLRFPRSASLTWTGLMPTGGVHLDVDHRHLHYWRADPGCAIERRVRDAWPGWRTEWLRDRYEAHLDLARVDCQLPLRQPAVLRTEVIEHLRRHCTRSAENPATKLAERIGATSVNPATAEARGSVGSEREKLQLLDRLEATTAH